MNKRGILLSLIICFLCIGCDKQDQNSIVGTWTHENKITYTFNKDYTCLYQTETIKTKCKYEINGKKLSVFYSAKMERLDTTYRIENNQLIIKNIFEEDVIYTKK